MTLLAPLAGIAAWYVWRLRVRGLRLAVSYRAEGGGAANIEAWVWVAPALMFLGGALAVAALARPQTLRPIASESPGLDVVLLMDVSASMDARDAAPSRLEAAKSIAGDYLALRPQDRVGVVVFSMDALTLLPPTHDLQLVKRQIAELKTDLLPKDGTALGTAIAAGVVRLEDSQSKTGMLVVLSDGGANMGCGEPASLAAAAAARGMTVHAVALGREGSDFDPATMARIAAAGNGIYVPPADPEAAAKIAAAAGTLAQSRKSFLQNEPVDRYPVFLTGALGCFILAGALRFWGVYNLLSE
ncbi:MAG: VWA domain-containing protein [Bacteroidia bacterium]|nr:VWA domain-containing protein [Bacteroidia bacterium]